MNKTEEIIPVLWCLYPNRGDGQEREQISCFVEKRLKGLGHKDGFKLGGVEVIQARDWWLIPRQ